MVLDSAMSPNQTDEQEMTYDIQGFESSIDAFIDWCVVRPNCALGCDKAAARGKIVEPARLGREERADDEQAGPAARSARAGSASRSSCASTPSQSWPTLNKGLAQAFTGKGDILLAKGMSVVERSVIGSSTPTRPTCRR